MTSEEGDGYLDETFEEEENEPVYANESFEEDDQASVDRSQDEDQNRSRSYSLFQEMSGVGSAQTLGPDYSRSDTSVPTQAGQRELISSSPELGKHAGFGLAAMGREMRSMDTDSKREHRGGGKHPGRLSLERLYWLAAHSRVKELIRNVTNNKRDKVRRLLNLMCSEEEYNTYVLHILCVGCNYVNTECLRSHLRLCSAEEINSLCPFDHCIEETGGIATETSGEVTFGTCMHHLVRGESAKGLNILHDAGADINGKDENGEPPIFVAVRKASKQMTLFFTSKKGFLPDVTNEKGQNAVHVMVQSWISTPEKFELNAKFWSSPFIAIFEKSFDNEDTEGDTPLMLAVQIKDYPFNMIKTLISLGARVDITNSLNRTVVHSMCMSPEKEYTDFTKMHLLKYLVSHGADVHIRDKLARTALTYALTNGLEEVAYYLAQNSSLSVTEVDEYQRKPLHLAAAGSHVPLIKHLVKTHPKACYNQSTLDGLTPVHIAAKGVSFHVLKTILLENKKAAGSRDVAKRTLVHVAAEDGQLETLKSLAQIAKYVFFEEDSISRHVDSTGRTPLMSAIQNVRMDVSIFLAELVPVWCIERDSMGRSPLQEAAKLCDLNLMEQIINGITTVTEEGSPDLAFEYDPDVDMSKALDICVTMGYMNGIHCVLQRLTHLPDIDEKVFQLALRCGSRKNVRVILSSWHEPRHLESYYQSMMNVMVSQKVRTLNVVLMRNHTYNHIAACLSEDFDIFDTYAYEIVFKSEEIVFPAEHEQRMIPLRSCNEAFSFLERLDPTTADAIEVPILVKPRGMLEWNNWGGGEFDECLRETMNLWKDEPDYLLTCDKYGYNLVHLLVSKGALTSLKDIEAVLGPLRIGRLINSRSFDGRTPLMCIGQLHPDDTSVPQSLLLMGDKDLDSEPECIREVRKFKDNSLIAYTRDHYNCCEHLIRELNCSFSDENDGAIILKQAIIGNSPDCVRLILEAGASLDSPLEYGNLPVHIATILGCNQVLMIVIEVDNRLEASKRTVNRKNHDGFTPAFIAIHHADLVCLASILRVLEDHNVNEETGTLLHLAVSECHRDQRKLHDMHSALGLLVSEVEQRATENGEGLNPYRLACRYGCLSCQKELAESQRSEGVWIPGCGVVDRYNQEAKEEAITIIFTPILEDIPDTLEIILPFVDVCFRNDEEDTAVLVCIKMHRLRCLEVITSAIAGGYVSKHAVNLPDSQGMRPVTLAIAKKQQDTLRTLMNCPGIDLLVPEDEWSLSAMAYALGDESGDLDFLRTLLERAVENNVAINVNIPGPKNLTALHRAFEAQDYNIIDLLMCFKDVNMNALDGMDESVPLRICRRDESPENILHVLETAKEKGLNLDVNLQDRDGETILHHAIEKNWLDMIVLLLREHKFFNTNVNIQDGSERTVLHKVLSQTQVDANCASEFVRLSQELEIDLDPNLKDMNGNTVLHLIVRRNDIEMLGILFSCDLDLSVLDPHGRTALHIAVSTSTGDTRCARAILMKSLEEGKFLNINHKDRKNSLVLFEVVRNNFLDILSLLLEVEDLDWNVRDSGGRVPLQVAVVEHPDDLKCAKLIIQRALQRRMILNLNRPCESGTVVLHDVMRLQLVDMLDPLMDLLDLDLNVHDTVHGRTALHWQILEQPHNLQCAKKMIEKAVERGTELYCNHRDFDHKSPLFYAIAHNNVEAFDCLSPIFGISRALPNSDWPAIWDLAATLPDNIIFERLLNLFSEPQCSLYVQRQVLRSSNAISHTIDCNRLDWLEKLLSWQVGEITLVALKEPLARARASPERDLLGSLLRRMMQQGTVHKGDIFFVVENNITFILKDMLEWKPNIVDLTNGNGIYLIHAATLNNAVDCMHLLLDKDPQAVHKTDLKMCSTPLHLGVEKECLDAARLLVQKGANINAISSDGCSVLHNAAEASNLTLVEELTTLGASINVRNNMGVYAIQCASDNSVRSFLAGKMLKYMEPVVVYIEYCNACAKHHNHHTRHTEKPYHDRLKEVTSLLENNFPGVTVEPLKVVDDEGNRIRKLAVGSFEITWKDRFTKALIYSKMKELRFPTNDDVLHATLEHLMVSFDKAMDFWFPKPKKKPPPPRVDRYKRRFTQYKNRKEQELFPASKDMEFRALSPLTASPKKHNVPHLPAVETTWKGDVKQKIQFTESLGRRKMWTKLSAVSSVVSSVKMEGPRDDANSGDLLKSLTRMTFDEGAPNEVKQPYNASNRPRTAHR